MRLTLSSLKGRGFCLHLLQALLQRHLRGRGVACLLRAARAQLLGRLLRRADGAAHGSQLQLVCRLKEREASPLIRILCQDCCIMPSLTADVEIHW